MHLNHKRSDNRVANLQYGTASENCLATYRDGNRPPIHSKEAKEAIAAARGHMTITQTCRKFKAGRYSVRKIWAELAPDIRGKTDKLPKARREELLQAIRKGDRTGVDLAAEFGITTAAVSYWKVKLEST